MPCSGQEVEKIENVRTAPVVLEHECAVPDIAGRLLHAEENAALKSKVCEFFGVV